MLSRPTIISLDSPLAELEARQIGDKALMLHTIAAAGLPVPRGFVVPADVARQISETHWLPEITDAARNWGEDCLFALRGSPLTSVSGLGESLINLGYTDDLAESLAKSSGEPLAAYETYRRFIQDYANIVMGDDPAIFDDIVALYMEERGFVSDTELQGSDARELAMRFKAQFESNNGLPFPQTLDEQLRMACIAINRSWNAPRAKTHRKLQGLAESTGLALVIHEVVQTGLGETSGVGRATTRNSQTGEAQLSGTFAPQAVRPALALDKKTMVPVQGGDVSLATLIPQAFAQLHDGLNVLERHLREGIEAEFAITEGSLFFLGARPARRSARAALHMAIDFANQRLLSREEAVLRVDPFSLDKLLHATINPDTKRTVIATGLGASPGAVAGMIVFDAEEARDLAAQGAAVILVRPETLPEDIRGLHAAEGVLTTRGSMASHAAVIARGMGKPAVTGASNLKIDIAEGKLIAPGLTLSRGDFITIDGSSGQILKGRVETEKPEISGDFATLLTWADNYRRMQVRANAETVIDARMARDMGAEGIGLVRTEHMFFEGDRLVAIREMILADKEKDRRAALAKALPMLRGDFVALFEIMTGLPVTIRLLDPPLHEFLPEGGAETDAVAKSLGTDGALLRKRINELSEQNPMLGHRGVRLLLSYPEIVEMQARAIFEAVAEVQKATGAPPIPEIMVPLVASRRELDLVRSTIESAAQAVKKETGLDINYRVGTMIELPRAALRAGDIAQSAEFFSFGTNDLTQTTYGISRDDSARFISDYQAKGIIKVDPFVSLDVEGVGELIKTAALRGRETRNDLHLGICGEHGGDPDSISFCEQIGLDYVSCSPYRVPIARLAAAQSHLRKTGK